MGNIFTTKENLFKTLVSITVCVFSFIGIIDKTYAQSPQAIPYQGVARNANGEIRSSQGISLRFSIHTGDSQGTVVFQETHSVTTSNLGLFNVSIGRGTQVGSASLAGVDWGNGSKYLQVEMDPAGGTSYVNMGTTQLNSVPYALYAANANVDISGKVDKVAGKSLVDDAEITRLAGLINSDTNKAYVDAQDALKVDKVEGKSLVDDTEIARLAGLINSDTNKAYVDAQDLLKVDKTITVNGKSLSNNVTLIKGDFGLENVENTSDVNKPVSALQQAALDLKENLSNKSTAGTLGLSDVLYPTQKAVKSYVDTSVSTVSSAIQANATAISAEAATRGAADTAHDTAIANNANAIETETTARLAADTSHDTAIANNANAIETETTARLAADTAHDTAIANNANAIETETSARLAADTAHDTAIGNNTSAITAETNNRIAADNLKANLASPTFTGTVSGIDKTMVGLGNVVNLDTSNPTNIVEDATHRFVTDAEKTIWNGKQNALGYTAEDSANKSTNVITDAVSDTKYPSVKSVKTYVDNQITGAATPDANNSVKGKIQLAGDLSGTAAAPTVANVGGATAANVANAANLANAATNANAVGTIVKRDASGNFSAGTITAALNGNATTVTTNANLTGDVTSVGNATTLSTTGVTAGTYTKVTVDAKGRVTAGASLATTDIPTGATGQSTVTSPTGTTNTTGLMMGLAGSITPVRSNKIMIIISGNITNNTQGSNGAKVQIRYGIGTAPVNAAALIGTPAGGLVNYLNGSISGGNGSPILVPSTVPFTTNAIVTGLTLNTAVWVDLSLAAIGSGTASVGNISISIIEL